MPGLLRLLDIGIGDPERFPRDGAGGAAFQEIEDIALRLEASDAQRADRLLQEHGEIDLLLQIAHTAGKERARRGAVLLQHALEGKPELIRLPAQEIDQPIRIAQRGVEVLVFGAVELPQHPSHADAASLEERVEFDAFIDPLADQLRDALELPGQLDPDALGQPGHKILRSGRGRFRLAPQTGHLAGRILQRGQACADIDQNIEGFIGHLVSSPWELSNVEKPAAAGRLA